ncbi:hypothetical protein B9479_005020 [Cryptococcus floricola]|uniref:Uncharacterized protein n=1 Tax=Cryptococcus floricola TaxID=2591691 RepID=A0A5D3AUN7_9TREE|nr:hypothetical protein B9479_005020 [Cryptococcus floricola]
MRHPRPAPPQSSAAPRPSAQPAALASSPTTHLNGRLLTEEEQGWMSKKLPERKSFNPSDRRLSEYRQGRVGVVAVPVPKGTELDIPFRNAAKFFARLSEAVCHEACDTIYHAPNSRRTREHRTFWLDRPRDYVGMNARDPLRESFGFWELEKPQRPSPKCPICDKLFSTKRILNGHS